LRNTALKHKAKEDQKKHFLCSKYLLHCVAIALLSSNTLGKPVSCEVGTSSIAVLSSGLLVRNMIAHNIICMLQGIFLTFIADIFCNKMILIVDMICATGLQIVDMIHFTCLQIVDMIHATCLQIVDMICATGLQIVDMICATDLQIVEMICATGLQIVNKIHATCLQIQPKQRNHKPLKTSYVNTKILATTCQKLMNPNKMLKLS
jgi:hypothetical protein